jgi:hypothetical protein
MAERREIMTTSTMKTNMDIWFQTCLENSEMFFTLHGLDYEMSVVPTDTGGSEWMLWNATDKKPASGKYPNMFEFAAAPIWGDKPLIEAWPDMILND